MPLLQRDGATLRYEVRGAGHPVLLFAPGGMRSRDEMWRAAPGGPPRPWCDWTQVLPAEGFTIVTMDQRNAGGSRAPVRADDGWQTYAADHLALMDHLGFARFHTLGGCIGSSFCLKLIEAAPQRTTAAVLQNPIGVHPQHPAYFAVAFADWARELMLARPELDAAAVAAFGRNLWQGEFVFSVSRQFVRACTTPCLVLPGNDTPHPAVVGNELADLLPGAERLVDWKGPQHLDEQRRRVVAFLRRHTP